MTDKRTKLDGFEDDGVLLMYTIGFGLAAFYLFAQTFWYFPDRSFLIASVLALAGLFMTVVYHVRWSASRPLSSGDADE